MTPERLLDPVGGLDAIIELDALVLFMTVAVTLHAVNNKNTKLLLAGFILGYLTETLSLRWGGTHCHASGILNFSDCSSANSVFYYVPWVYSGITCGRRLVDERSASFPFVCGLLFFGMCGIYECQGPSVRWWLWPDEEGVVKPGSSLQQFGDLAADTRGMVAAAHVQQALSARVFGMPVMAPYFHSAFGWGIALAFQWVGLDGSILNHLAAALLGPALAMLWEVPVRLLPMLLGASQAASVAGVMLCGFFLALLAGPTLNTTMPRDPLLLVAPAANTFFFVYQALVGRGAELLSPDLKVLVTGVGLVAFVAFSRAAGIISGSGTKKSKHA